MKHFLCTAFAFLLLLDCAQAQPLTLSKDGKTEYIIVLPAAPTAVEQTAAKELKEHLDAVTGAGFAIVKETETDAAKPQGRTSLLLENKNKIKDVAYITLQKEKCRKNFPKNVFYYGGRYKDIRACC